MILLAVIVVAILFSLVKGGRLGNLAKLQIVHEWLPLSLFLVQAGIVLFPIRENREVWSVQAPVIVSSYAGLLAFLYFNRSLPGVKLILLGGVLNLVVILANGGFMPVSQEALRIAGHENLIVARGNRQFVLGSKDIVLESSKTRLAPLSDIMVIPEDLPLSGSFSVGDVLIAIGVSIFLIKALK